MPLTLVTAVEYSQHMAKNQVDHPPRIDDELLSVQRVAELCNCHPGTVYRWIEQGRFGVVNPKREYVIRKEEFEQWLAKK